MSTGLCTTHTCSVKQPQEIHGSLVSLVHKADGTIAETCLSQPLGQHYLRLEEEPRRMELIKI